MVEFTLPQPPGSPPYTRVMGGVPSATPTSTVTGIPTSTVDGVTEKNVKEGGRSPETLNDAFEVTLAP
jgi:hypothetical protein